MLRNDASVVVLDVKGDLLRNYGKAMEKNGYQIKCLDVISSDFGKSHMYNPFVYVKREYKLSDIAFSNEKIEEFYKDYGDGNVSSSWDKVTIFYNKQGEKLFKFGLAYDNVQLLVRDVKNTQRSISNQKKEK